MVLRIIIFLLMSVFFECGSVSAAMKVQGRHARSRKFSKKRQYQIVAALFKRYKKTKNRRDLALCKALLKKLRTTV